MTGFQLHEKTSFLISLLHPRRVLSAINPRGLGETRREGEREGEAEVRCRPCRIPNSDAASFSLFHFQVIQRQHEREG